MPQKTAQILQTKNESQSALYNYEQAVEMGYNVNYVSRAINTVFGKSFKQLLTEYRIRQACRLLSDADNSKLTIQAIYEAVGYRAASSFISAFKKEMGMTPSVNLRLQRGQASA